MAGFLSGIWRRLREGGAATGGVVEGFIGSRLADLEGTHDFFRFFHFESIGVEKRYDDGDVVMAFRPSGPDFRDLVKLRAWVSRGIIRTIRLTVNRSFIDGPRTCMFAADLYNSFLRSVGEVREGDAIDAFAREITARSMGRSGMPVIVAGAVPHATGRESAAYRVYAGEAEAENLIYGSNRLKLVARNGQGEFEILVWAMDEEEKARGLRPVGS